LASVPPANSARAQPAAPTGSAKFAVQVSSQRSEAEASAAYRTLQSRYPNVLGGRSSFVRRADLGSRGIYYRTMVGPFATAEEAAQLCTSLKAAGGQCILHRN
jgi:cell division septation protein DedD